MSGFKKMDFYQLKENIKKQLFDIDINNLKTAYKKQVNFLEI